MKVVALRRNTTIAEADKDIVVGTDTSRTLLAPSPLIATLELFATSVIAVGDAPVLLVVVSTAYAGVCSLPAR
jgi:hypothetical protein